MKIQLFIAIALLTGCSTMKTVSGIATAYAIHESGHQLAAVATDTDLRWETSRGLAFYERSKNATSGAIVNASGITAQMLSSEIIIDEGWHNSFVDGVMIWNVINPIMYALDYWIGRGASNRFENGGYFGDLAGVEFYAGDSTANVFAAASVAISIWQACRYTKSDNRRSYGVGIGPGEIFLVGEF